MTIIYESVRLMVAVTVSVRRQLARLQLVILPNNACLLAREIRRWLSRQDTYAYRNESNGNPP